MATYAQWRRLADEGQHKRLTWICGSEPTLRLEVLLEIQAQVLALCRQTFTAGSDKDRDIWAAAMQLPHPGESRMVTIRNAEKLKAESRVVTWADTMKDAPTCWLLFETSAKDLDSESAMGQIVRKKGRIIKCTSPNEEDAVAWVQRHGPACSIGEAEYLLARTGGDLGRARSVLTKACIIGSLDTRVIDRLASESIIDEFADAMIRCDSRAAARAAEVTPDHASALGLLAYKLDQMELIVAMAKVGTSPRDMVRTVPPVVVKALRPHIARHDKNSTIRRRILLAEASAAQGGMGALELLAARW